MHNVPEQMKEAVLKLKALEICPNIIGQITVNFKLTYSDGFTC
jgi:hypothetical protein